MMDRTSWIGTIVCIGLLIGWTVHSSNENKKLAEKAATQKALTPPTPTAASASGATSSTRSASEATLPNTTSASTPPQLSSGAPVAQLASPNMPTAIKPTLSNDFMKVIFTSIGGGIEKIELKKHKVDDDTPVVFSSPVPEPIMGFSWEKQPPLIHSFDVKKDRKGVSFSRTLKSGMLITRYFQIVSDYEIKMTDTFSNPTGQALSIPPRYIYLGVAAPVNEHDITQYIGSLWLESGSDNFADTNVNSFEPSGFLGMNFSSGKGMVDSGNTPLRWVCLQSQFFISVLTPSPQTSIAKALFYPVKLAPWKGQDSAAAPKGVRGTVLIPGWISEPQTAKSDEFTFYAGPKAYARVKEIGYKTDLIMQFKLMKLPLDWIAVPLLSAMNFIYKLTHNYGVAIILLTILLKLFFWPLQSAANKSMKKMQALGPKIKELQAKNKENKQKQQMETMKLYKEYGVNPMGGCLPMLVQIPIFMGFYTMLISSVEMRHASFLWVADLSKPDTIATIPFLFGGLDINPLPIIMTATSVFLSHISMKANPSQQQAGFMKWMPLIFLFVLYNFASALSLYWTVNNLISLLQTWLNLKKPLPKLERVKKTKKKDPFRKAKI